MSREPLIIIVAGQEFNLDRAIVIGTEYNSKNPDFWRDLMRMRHFENMEHVSRTVYGVNRCISVANGGMDFSYCPADRRWIINHLQSLPQGSK